MKAEGTRAAILGAAVELGSLRGLEELSMGGLASTVEMSKSGLFAHFGSKEELQLATVARAWEVFESEVVPEPPDGPPPSLEDLLERWLSFFERRIFPGGCFFVISAVEFAGLGGPVRDALAHAVKRQTAALETAVRAANESGELSDARDARETAFALHSILVNANSLFIVHGDPSVFDDARATIADLLGAHRRPGGRALARQT
jgi:AcrR family transcriptional regulator